MKKQASIQSLAGPWGKICLEYPVGKQIRMLRYSVVIAPDRKSVTIFPDEVSPAKPVAVAVVAKPRVAGVSNIVAGVNFS